MPGTRSTIRPRLILPGQTVTICAKKFKRFVLAKKDMQQLGRGNLAGVMTGEGILQGMKERDMKDAEKQATRAAKAAAKAAKPPVTPHVISVRNGPGHVAGFRAGFSRPGRAHNLEARAKGGRPGL
ncbi:hypothetical protein BDD12DRAFT_809441 [Trichophaea hybrida]|nr:hypothetical protein BDD12DRAFT_809441 [Trichophaea hybrida]